MSDLVEQLRAPTGYYGVNSEDGGKIYDQLRLEAADEIERLRAATVRLTEEINELRQNRERLRDQNKWLCERMVELETKCSKLLSD